ncbi:short transient receptor potential channel 5-like [Centruroides vittatus]|uniref:short transient receptor potential channel 5-like n=1 Tax=Centruroides vittatus TaxID=120091 RepID=UPI0035103164
MKTLFWALFGLIDLDFADVIVGIETETSPEGIIYHSFTQAIRILLFGSYHVLMIKIFISILIAVLTNTSQKVMKCCHKMKEAEIDDDETNKELMRKIMQKYL